MLPRAGSSSALAHSLPEQIARRIADDIIEERYAPGVRLKEVELAQSFNVSRAPVREALRILETQRLVRLTPQRGAYVVSLSIEELADLFSIRAVLMGLSARKIAEKGSALDHVALRKRVDALKLLAEREDLTKFVRDIGELSLFAAEIAGPGWVHDFLLIAVRQTVRYSYRGLMTPQGASEITGCWEKLMDAISVRNANGAEAAAKSLMLTAWKLARPVMEARKSKG